MDETIIQIFNMSSDIGEAFSETISQILPFTGQDSDLVDQDLTYVPSQDGLPVSPINQTLFLDETLTAYEPYAIFIQTLSLQEDLRSSFPDPTAENSRTRALGPLPPNHPGA